MTDVCPECGHPDCEGTHQVPIKPDDLPRSVLLIDASTCPNCGGTADNGHDRSYPPNPYHCTKCEASTEANQ